MIIGSAPSLRASLPFASSPSENSIVALLPLNMASAAGSGQYRAEREDYARLAFPPPPPHKLESLRGPGLSNVVIKGFVLQGGHPGISSSEVVSNLTPLLRAGVSCFVCLQHELPKPGSTVALSRSTYGRGNVVTARHYLADAQAMVDAGGFPQSGSAPLSFL